MHRVCSFTSRIVMENLLREFRKPSICSRVFLSSTTSKWNSFVKSCVIEADEYTALRRLNARKETLFSDLSRWNDGFAEGGRRHEKGARTEEIVVKQSFPFCRLYDDLISRTRKSWKVAERRFLWRKIKGFMMIFNNRRAGVGHQGSSYASLE